MAWNDKEKCPVCRAECLATGMKNHIVGKAKAELFIWYFDRSTTKPHLDFYQGHATVEEVKKVSLKI